MKKIVLTGGGTGGHITPHLAVIPKLNENGFKTYYIGSTCYKKYNSALESYEDHSKHIKSRKWYASLFSLNITDYKKWAHGLKKAGYAQDPYYAYRLIQIIDKYKFHSLDSLYNPADTILSK